MQSPLNEAIMPMDDAGGVGEDLVPFAEDFVGGEQDGAGLVASGHHLEEQIGGVLSASLHDLI